MIQTTVNPIINQTADSDPGYGQLFAVLVRRFPWFLGVFLASIAIAGFITKNTPETYQSEMQLLVEPNFKGKQQGGGDGVSQTQFTDPNVEIDTATQLNLMRNTQHIEKAVKMLENEYPDMTVEDVRGSLVLSQIKEKEDNIATKIFDAKYTDTDPQKTQRVLQALQQVYLDYNEEQQQKRLSKGLKVINEQLEKVRKDLADSERRLLRFRKTQNLTDPESQVKNLEQELSGIEQERRNVRAQFQEGVARYNSLQEQLQRTPRNALVSARLSQSTRYQELLNQIQKTDLALEQERLRFTDEAPSVRKLIEQRQRQQVLLQREVATTLGGDPSAINSIASSNLQAQGNDSQIDLNLAAQLVEAQTNVLGLRARDQSLAQKETIVRDNLKRFPALLADFNRLQPLVTLNRQRFEQLLKAEQQLRQELDKGGFVWEVVEKPQEGIFVGPNMRQNLMLGAVVGLILGGITAALREVSDDAVHTTAELEKQVSLPLLGTTPKLSPTRNRDSAIKLPFGKPDASAPWTIQVLQSPPRWESLDLIYKNIELLNSVTALKSLMVTSALPDDGKSALALGLAMSAARLHKRVLLIDANLREPSLHKQLNLPNEQGLSTLLSNDVDLPDRISLQSSGSSFIDILTAGPVPADPANLLSSPRMNQLIANFEENYDLVLIDAPPVLGIVDTLLTGSACRSTLMVASIGRITRSQLAQATAMLSKLNLIGVVANGVSNSNSTYIPYNQEHRLALQQAVEK